MDLVHFKELNENKWKLVKLWWALVWNANWEVSNHTV